MFAEVLSDLLPNMVRQDLGNLYLGKVSTRKDLDINIGPLRYPKICDAQPDFAEAANRPGERPFCQIFPAIIAIFETSPHVVPDPGYVVPFQPLMVFGT